MATILFVDDAAFMRPNGEVRDHYRYDEFGVPAPRAKLSEDGRNVNHNSRYAK